MRVLVIGNGGREHALIWKLSRSPHVKELYSAAGNGGIKALASCVPIQPESTVELARFAKDMGVGLTVVGPELPLSLGIGDVFRKMGLRIFGPSAEAAQLESSKVFAKLFMERHKIPTPPFQICGSYQEAEDIIKKDDFGYPLVIKADGLAAGKGVVVCNDQKEALNAAKLMMVEKKFGPSGERIIVEQCLTGQEMSFMVISDGERFIPLLPSSDYKRAFDNDEGPNTGGMGAYCPTSGINRDTFMKTLTTIIGPTIAGMIEEGRPYQGLLYGGLMMTEDGPKVLEFNCRFGDPETQVVLPLIKSDLYELLFSAAEGNLTGVKPVLPKGNSVTVVVAAEGYPGSYKTGMKIKGIKKAEQVEGVTVFHAGTILKDDGYYTSGGRVLNVTAVGPNLPKAIYQAYQAAEMISFEGARYRTDIGHNAIVVTQAEKS